MVTSPHLGRHPGKPLSAKFYTPGVRHTQATTAHAPSSLPWKGCCDQAVVTPRCGLGSPLRSGRRRLYSVRGGGYLLFGPLKCPAAAATSWFAGKLVADVFLRRRRR
jgi:hypothetical protein